MQPKSKILHASCHNHNQSPEFLPHQQPFNSHHKLILLTHSKINNSSPHKQHSNILLQHQLYFTNSLSITCDFSTIYSNMTVTSSYTTIKPSLSSNNTTTSNNNSNSNVVTSKSLVTKCNSKIQLKLFPTSTSLSLLTLFTTPFEVKAITLPKDQLVSSLTQAEQTIDQVQQVGSDVLETAQQVFQAVAGALKPGIDAATPFVVQAGQEALKAASPVVSEASKKAQELMQTSGISSESVATAAKTVTSAAEQTGKVIQDAKPIASSTVETIANSDPALIVEATAGLFLAYLLLPSVWSAITFNFRGYKGGLTPAQTLDMLCTQNYYLIDIRSEKDKNKAGIPQLPPSAKSRIIAVPLEEIPSKLKSQVRNTKKVEAEIAALKISYLKRLNKGSSIVIMDSYSDSAKIVAKTLTSLGFKNTWIMADGFSGGKGWSQSRLGTESYNLSFAEIFTPSRIIPGRSGTISSTVQTTRRLLPGSK